MDFAVGVNSVVAHASGRIVGTDQVGLCHFQLPHCIGRLAVRLFSVPLPVSTNAMDRAREAGRPACPLLVVRLGRNAGCHLVLDITFPPFRMIAPLAKLLVHDSMWPHRSLLSAFLRLGGGRDEWLAALSKKPAATKILERDPLA